MTEYTAPTSSAVRSPLDNPLQSEGWQDQQCSVLFRRGLNMCAPDRAFADVELALDTASQGKDHIEMLVVGVASGQEPLSSLVVLDALARQRGRRLRDFVGLDLVDTRPPLQAGELQDSVHDFALDAALPGDILIAGGLEPGGEEGTLRVRQDIIDFFMSVVTDRRRASWRTRVQDYLAQPESKQYDCISYNNVEGHIPGFNNRELILRGLIGRLSNGGVLITDAYYGGGNTLQNLWDYAQVRDTYGLAQIAPGIFRRS